MNRWRERMATVIREAAAAAAVLLCATAAAAHSTGETGHSGKQRSTCNECHSGGTAPDVRFSGPQSVTAGDIVTYRFEVQSMRGAQRAAGFNVAVSDGSLDVASDEDEQLILDELTHTMPKINSDMIAAWEFRWTAPLAPGAVTLFGAGNSVNRNGQDTGDRASVTTLVVAVVEATATPTATALPATPTLTTTPTPASTQTAPGSAGPSPTGGAARCVGDCDDSRSVAVNELVAGVGIALGTQSIDACRADDSNGDGHVSINEVIAAVANALDGCP